MSEKKCCGTCIYGQYEEIDEVDGTLVCVNDSSDYYTDWIECDFCCEEWEKKCR